MKKVVIFLLLVSVVAICNAQIVERNSNGDYRVVIEEEKWQGVGVVAEEEAWFYIKFFPEAISNPNSLISVEKSERIMKITGLFKALKKVEEKNILFNPNENKIVFVEEEEEKEEKSFILVFALASVLLMFASNISFKMKNSFWGSAAFAAAFVAAAAFAVAAAVAVAVAVAAAAAFAAAVAAAVAVAVAVAVAADINNKGYKFFVTIYYIFMSAYFIFIFLGI